MRVNLIPSLSLWYTLVLKFFGPLIGEKWKLVLVVPFDYLFEYCFIFTYISRILHAILFVEDLKIYRIINILSPTNMFLCH